MIRREFLMLATNWNPQKHKTEGSFMSEKLDGMRCVWIPSTRGQDFQNIPFANTNKDERKHSCSGLWSRYGKPIFAPDWFLDLFPEEYPVDGELYAGRGEFQSTMSFVKKHKPVDSEWKQVGFYAFDIPSYSRIFQPGRINNPNFAEKIIPEGVATKLGIDVLNPWIKPRRFEYNYQFLCKNMISAYPGQLKGEIGVLIQEQLPFSRFEAERLVQERLASVNNDGGEGLILRRPHSEWQPQRTTEIMKVKQILDAEGVIVGFTYGTGKLTGMVGSIRLLCDFGSGQKEFDLSGFTDAERGVRHEFRKEANMNQLGYVKKDVSSVFAIGEKLTFVYRELTADGLPKEARFLRKRAD